VRPDFRVAAAVAVFVGAVVVDSQAVAAAVAFMVAAVAAVAVLAVAGKS
jgi:hypothetical protein